jgi:hypothetical protein
VRRALVDTSVLFPFSVMDLLLALTEDSVHQVLWTDDPLDEWERVIVREQRRSAEAAAIAAGADALVTSNLADFPAAPLAERGVRVVDPDTYLCELLDEYPAETVATARRVVSEKARPPITNDDFLQALRGAGLCHFPTRLAVLL